MKYFKTLIAALVTLVMVSCSFTEKMTMNEDGTGRLSLSFDGSELMSSMGGLGGDEQDGEEEKIDSIIDFKEFMNEYKDSIATLSAEDQAKFKALEPFKMRIQMDEAEGLFMFDMFSDFENISEVNNIQDAFNNVSNIMGDGQAQQQNNSQESAKVEYSFEGNTFIRDAYIIDAEKYSAQLDSLASMEMFLAGSTYTLEYTFPRKIKSVNVEGYTLSEDGKTLYYEVDYMAYMKDPNIMDLQVDLED